MNKIAIISFNHEESTLCLAKYIAKLGYAVDYYYINRPNSKGLVPGFEFWRAKIHWGLQKLSDEDIPEICSYMDCLPVKIFLITYDSSRRYSWFGLDKLTLWFACKYISKNHYDAIDIVGQHDYVKWCHIFLNGQNITHTYHEIGSHHDGIPSSPAVEISVSDSSKVIIHSNFSFNRYLSLQNVKKDRVSVIPFGKFETLKLYAKDVIMDIALDFNKITFLFIGLIRPYKGLDLLAKSMDLLKPYFDRFNLIVAGKGDDPSLSYFKSLPNCYVYNRFINNDEMMYLIKKCTLVVLPYRTASQTGIIPTIALYGKPSIATSVGAFPEIIENEKNGLLVDKDDPKKFANAMFRCIDDDKLVGSLCEGMSKYGNGDKWDWGLIAKQTLSVLLSS